MDLSQLTEEQRAVVDVGLPCARGKRNPCRTNNQGEAMSYFFRCLLISSSNFANAFGLKAFRASFNTFS